MTKRKDKKLPKFKTEDEEADFWATHSPLDYPSEFEEMTEPIELSPELRKRIESERLDRERKKTVTFRMEPSKIDLIKLIARRNGIDYQPLMRMWIIQGIDNELSRNIRLRRALTRKRKPAR